MVLLKVKSQKQENKKITPPSSQSRLKAIRAPEQNLNLCRLEKKIVNGNIL